MGDHQFPQSPQYTIIESSLYQTFNGPHDMMTVCTTSYLHFSMLFVAEKIHFSNLLLSKIHNEVK